MPLPKRLGRLTSRRELLLAATACVTLSVASVAPFHFLGRAPAGGGPWRVRMPATHDIAMHFDHMRAFARGLAAGRVYPRWEEPTNAGFGAPSTAFHPPGVYYLTSLVHVVARDWGLTFLITHLVLMLASGASVYVYARRSLSAPAAVLAVAAYVILPYHLLDLYQRGALAEYLNFVWMPLAWLCVETIFDGGGRRGRLLATTGLALAFGALFWSHPPTAFQFALTSGAFALGLAITRRDVAGLALATLGVALGVGLSAAYLYPAVVEQGFVRSDVFRSRWAYGESYVFLPRPADSPPEFWALINAVWILGAVCLPATAVALLAGHRKTSLGPALRERALLWTLMGSLVLFLMTPAASFLEPLVPGLEMTSFPWRMLSILTLTQAMLVGAALEASLVARRWLAGAAAALVVAGGAVFSVVLVIAPAPGALSFTPRPDRPTANKFWVLPRWAPEDPRMLPQMERAMLARGAGRVAIERWDPETRVLAVELKGSGRLAVRTFDFPGWTATLDGHPATIEHGAFGNIELSLRGGAHRVVLDFQPTPARRIGVVLSLASLAVVAAMAVCAGRPTRVG